MPNNNELNSELTPEVSVSTVADIWSYIQNELPSQPHTCSKDFLLEVPHTSNPPVLNKITINKSPDGLQAVIKVRNTTEPSSYYEYRYSLTNSYGIMESLFDFNVYDSFQDYVIHKLDQKLDDRYTIDESWSIWSEEPLSINTTPFDPFKLKVYFHKYSVTIEYFDEEAGMVKVKTFTADEIFADDAASVAEYINHLPTEILL